MFARETLSSPYLSYGTETYGTNLKMGVPLREDLTLQLRYSIYSNQITLVSELNDCNNISPNGPGGSIYPTPNALIAAGAAGPAILALSLIHI